MDKPLPFLIERNGNLDLNDEVIKILEKSINPRLLLFYGQTRQGKSTTLNQLIRGNVETWKYMNKSPFLSQTSQQSLTIGCDIYGPIKSSEINRRHQINRKIKEDFDIFFCDTEGLFSLNGQSSTLIPGILTLLQVCTFSVIMINNVADTNTVDQIASEIQFTKILQQINKDIKSPLVSIYISGYQVDIEKLDDFDDCISEYNNNRDQTSDLILSKVNEKYPNLNITKKDYRVIPGGPYEKNNNKEPDHDDLKAKLYWHSIKEIIKEFNKFANETESYSADKLISMIKVVFGIFKEFKELPKDPNLTNVLKKYLVDNFNKYSLKQFEKINEEIEKDLKNNYGFYYKILLDDNAALEKLNNCIEKNMYEIYTILIPEKIKNFFENAKLKIRNLIELQFEAEFANKCKEILSANYINELIADIKNVINKANFREDIDMNIINNYKKIWEIIDKKYENLFIYFKSKKPKSIEILKNNFNNSLEKIINDLILAKKEWKIYFEEIKETIKQEINNQYLQVFRKIKYQEDFDKLIKTSDQLSKELIDKYNQKYFKNLSEEKKSDSINWIKKVCDSEYNKLKEDNKIKPIWGNINKNIKTRIKEKIINYINNIFQGKKFRNEVDPNLGRNDVIIKEIPKELINSPEITKNKQKELISYLNNEVNNGVILFNKKREELPLLEKVIINTEKLCNEIADKKIKELLSKFYYQEDKLHFNADNFYSLFKKNEKIISLVPPENKELNDLINEISKKKAYEYNNILISKLPSWNKIKENIKFQLQDVCNNFYREIMGNKAFKEDIKYDIKNLDNKINSLNLFNNIMQNKHNEIKELIYNMKENIKAKIENDSNKLSKWSDQRKSLIQEGYTIMLNKSDFNLGTKDINEIKKILIKEVENTPRFFDAIKNESQKKEIMKELEKKAEEIGKKYLMKKAEEEKVFRELNEKNKKKAEELQKHFENNLNKISQENNNLKREIEELKRKQTPPPPPPPQVNYFRATPYTGVSIVDGLAAIGEPRSYDYRAQIAARNGIGGYVGSPAQNLHMLSLLKQGRLIKP
jgi:hypothetical protein